VVGSAKLCHFFKAENECRYRPARFQRPQDFSASTSNQKARGFPERTNGIAAAAVINLYFDFLSLILK
jgi:hypothetical protein